MSLKVPRGLEFYLSIECLSLNSLRHQIFLLPTKLCLLFCYVVIGALLLLFLVVMCLVHRISEKKTVGARIFIVKVIPSC